METDSLESPEEAMVETAVVRIMKPEDLDAVVKIDAMSSGRSRPEYFKLMLERSVNQAGMQISLAAEVEGRVVGFAIGSLYYGQFGIMEPSASIEAICVAPDARRQGVAQALMRQLRTNLGALGVSTIRTDVSWCDFDLLAFFEREGFAPAARLCLEKRLG